MKEQLESFSRAFSGGTTGCCRTCDCGKTFYDTHNDYDWEPNEFDNLQADKQAVPIEHSIGTVEFEGHEYVMDCTCWHERAKKIINWMDSYIHRIATYINLVVSMQTLGSGSLSHYQTLPLIWKKRASFRWQNLRRSVSHE